MWIHLGQFLDSESSHRISSSAVPNMPPWGRQSGVISEGNLALAPVEYELRCPFMEG